MLPKLPKPVWNGLSVFFAAGCAVSGWLLAVGDASPETRFALAVCGVLALLTGSVGGWFRGTGRGLFACGWKKAGRWMGISFALLLVAGVVASFVQIVQVGETKATSSSIRSELKQEALALLEYANAHNGLLPPDMREEHLAVSLLPYRAPARFPSEPHRDRRADWGKPFVWCKSLAGLRMSDITESDKVVAAYSSKRIVGVHADGYSVVYLDGHTKAAQTRQALLDLLRDRDTFLAPALRAKAKQFTAKNPAERKPVP